LPSQRAEEVRGETESSAARVHTNLAKLLYTLKNPTHTLPPSERTTNDPSRKQILESADTIQDLLAEGLSIASSLFPTNVPFKPSTKKPRSMFWPKTVKRDILALRHRSILLRHLARLNLKSTQSQTTPNTTLTPANDKNNHIINILTTPSIFETKLHTHIRSTVNLGLLPPEPSTANASNVLESAAILS